MRAGKYRNHDRKKEEMKIEEAIQLTIRTFPFEWYMAPSMTTKREYSNIANTVLRYLQTGSTILDFGSGPCDKTAVLQFLGFYCSAYDDLQDDWHKISGNREKIVSFAEAYGIDFKHANGGTLPFEKNFFDMIMLHGVLEHLHNSPRDILNDLLSLAKPNGLLFVTVPNAANIRKRIDVLFGGTNYPRFEIYYWYPEYWRGHVREYVKNDLIELSTYLNLEILELRGCDHMLQQLHVAARPAYLLLTKIFTSWKDSWLLVARKKPDWQPKTTLSQAKFAKVFGENAIMDPQI